MNKVKILPDGCWQFIGAIKFGYGLFWLDGKLRLAHRVSFELFKSKIPDGFFVCHTCDVKCCVNPEHFFLGKQLENARDAVLKKRPFGCNVNGNAPRGERNHNAKLTAAQVAAIKTDSRVHHIIAKDYGVTRAAISHLKRGLTWSA